MVYSIQNHWVPGICPSAHYPFIESGEWRCRWICETNRMVNKIVLICILQVPMSGLNRMKYLLYKNSKTALTLIEVTATKQRKCVAFRYMRQYASADSYLNLRKLRIYSTTILLNKCKRIFNIKSSFYILIRITGFVDFVHCPEF
jgi:hypothetical protein